MRSLRVRSPAKLNLFLHITGRRADGYHNLQTLFQFVDLCDELELAVTTDGQLEVTPPLPDLPPEANLIYRAARCLQAHTGSTLGARIHLHKRIPMGGGLGGGSSNAASTLVALNHLWGTGLHRQQLQSLGLTLGADVPVFIYGHAALAEGVGERLQAVDPPQPWYLIAAPDCHASTAELFQAKQLTRDSKLLRIRDFLAGEGHNDFEPVLRERFPLIDRCLTLMNREGAAKVTGSGACLFLACRDQADAEQKRQSLVAKMSSFDIAESAVSWKIAKGRNDSPLYTGELSRPDFQPD
ncbi:MAG: 4-(cytidine 5'-diphospho)-2-C-methyl-D-erythritol kinase [Pseudomonadota bacterium]|nr:4-(cytidine 5'-diphospho)-2-C-methyl-D-erythritol kinase [Pseudomonadales bacterium]MDY6921549.1 4-(cytidine 5'-diphospho)-2-C-methyl-D-erythritol kinase [Pseudomonadota bacterium]